MVFAAREWALCIRLPIRRGDFRSAILCAVSSIWRIAPEPDFCGARENISRGSCRAVRCAGLLDSSASLEPVDGGGHRYCVRLRNEQPERKRTIAMATRSRAARALRRTLLPGQGTQRAVLGRYCRVPARRRSDYAAARRADSRSARSVRPDLLSP